jgi:hypothetical protein
VIAGAGREFGQFLAEQADTATIRFLHTAEQAEQGGLAAAARAFEEQGFPGSRRNAGYPATVGDRANEAQVGQFDECWVM